MKKKLTALCAGALAVGLAFAGIAFAADWPSTGHDLRNSRHQADEKKISRKTAPDLMLCNERVDHRRV